jgi:hypothetical protein
MSTHLAVLAFTTLDPVDTVLRGRRVKMERFRKIWIRANNRSRQFDLLIEIGGRMDEVCESF